MPPRRERKYTLDTNLFVRAFRNPAANAALQLFHTAFAPFEYLSAVVVQELRAGARSAPAAAALEHNVFAPFERRGRLLTPSYEAWKLAGGVLARLAPTDGLEAGAMPRACVNHVLLALSCREAGVILVTENRRDFERVRQVIRFEFVDPWPTPAT